MTDDGFARWSIRVEDTDASTFTFYKDDATQAQIDADDLAARFDLTGMTIRLSIEWAGGSLLFVTGVDEELVMLDQSVAEDRGQISANLTTAQRLLLPTDGSQIRFNIQRVDGALKISGPFGEIVAERWVQNA